MSGGWRHSPEAREKIRAASAGRVMSPEARQAISDAQKARHARLRAEREALERARMEVPDAVAESVIWPAVTLVGLVRDRDAARIASLIAGLSEGQRAALPVVLAAMVDDGQTPAELLAWLDDGEAA